MDERNERPINWYPGHMAKAKHLIQDQLRRTDLVIEICDARLPFSSRNPDLMKMSAGKKHLLLLNKSDLADETANKQWLQFFRTGGIDAHLTNALKLRSKETLQIIDRATKDLVQKAQEKGVRKTIHAMVVGVPNVGKSTVINRLRGSNIAQTGDRPGVTRSNQMIHITPYLDLLDTPGLLWPRLDNQDSAKKLCYIGTVKDDVVDLYELTLSLLKEIRKTDRNAFISRFHPDNPDAEGTELIESVCRGRGWLLKGNEYDYERCCRVVLDEFRAGKVGKITLEKPCTEPVLSRSRKEGEDLSQ